MSKTVTFVPAHIAADINDSAEFEEGVVSGITIGISIRHPDEETLFALDDGWYTIKFDDTETPCGGLVMFDINQATYLSRIVSSYEHVVVHCTAGMSRSAAVAKWMSDRLGYELVMHQQGVGTVAHYNKHVYRTLDAANGYDMASYYENLEREQRMMEEWK